MHPIGQSEREGVGEERGHWRRRLVRRYADDMGLVWHLLIPIASERRVHVRTGVEQLLDEVDAPGEHGEAERREAAPLVVVNRLEAHRGHPLL